MVDIEDLEKEKDRSSGSDSSSSSSSSSSSETSSGGSSSGGGGSGDVFSMTEDEMIDPSGKNVSDVSSEWASDKGELNTDAHSGEDIDSYIKRQVREVEELHENIEGMAMDHKENFDEFTLYMHALFINFARNRVGIMEELRGNYGKGKREAYELANKICSKAGEGEFMEQMVRGITEDLAEL